MLPKVLGITSASLALDDLTSSLSKGRRCVVDKSSSATTNSGTIFFRTNALTTGSRLLKVLFQLVILLFKFVTNSVLIASLNEAYAD